MSDSTKHNDPSSTSGWLTDEYEGVSAEFTHLEPLSPHGHNTFTRAQRYGRRYLLKGLTAETVGQAAYREALRKEFDIMMRVQHTNVVQAMDFASVDGVGPCIVMEWVEGVTLAQWLADDTTRSDRQRVYDQLLDAMEQVHSAGIAHRDIKPSNIMVTTNGLQLKLIDFGLADTDVHTVFKQPGGTAQYMAPEQATESQPDVRNDIYSLGMVLRQMRLGRLANAVASRCLRPIDERPQSVAELRRMLHRAKQATRWGLRLAAVAALAAAATAWWMSRPAAPAASTELVDSLRQELSASIQAQQQSDTTQQLMQQHMTSLNDSLRELRQANDALVQREQERLTRQRAVDDAIDKGVALVREANRATHISEHLDTVSRSDYVWLDSENLIKQGRVKANNYLLSLANQFSPKEMAEIEYAINEYCNDYERRMYQKHYSAFYERATTGE